MNNNNQQPQKDIHQVLEKIRAGEIRMRPRMYFTLKVLLISVVFVLTLITSVFLISYIIFSLVIGGKLLLLGFGLRGIQVFLLAFPWSLVFIEIILLYILEHLVKRFQFGYRSPAVYVIGGLVCIVVISGIGINATPVHGFLLKRAEHKQLPLVFGNMYQHIKQLPRDRGVCRGTVTAVQDRTFTLREDDADNAEKYKIIIVPPDVSARDLVETGETVFVAGDIINGTIHAYGIKKIIDTDEMK